MNKEKLKSLMLLVACLLGGWYALFVPSEDEHWAGYRKELEALEHRNDSLLRQSQSLDSINRQLAFQADSLLVLLVQDRAVVQQLKLKKSEAINAIDGYNDRQLFEFFSTLDPDSAAQ